MNRFKKVSPWFSMLLVAASFVLLTAGECGAPRTQVRECSQYNDKETECNLAKQTDGKKCIYVDGKCEVFKHGNGNLPPSGTCEDFGTDAAKCGMRIDCAINATSTKCESAASDCANVKDATACKTTYGAASNAKCEWAGGACKKIVTPTLSKYTIYDFGAVPNASIKSDPLTLHSAASSGAGVVYVAGQGDGAGGAGNIATIDRSTDGVIWTPVQLTTPGQTPAGAVVNTSYATNDAGAIIHTVGSLHNGIIVYEPHGGLIGIIWDADNLKVSTKWTRALADIAAVGAPPLSFFEVKKGNDYFVYGGNATAADGISYYKTGAVPSAANAWIKGYTKDGVAAALTESYSQFANTPTGGLYLGANDKQIYEIDNTAVGAALAADAKLVGNGAAPFVSANPNLQHVAGTANGAITAMLLVDNKYLLIGFFAGGAGQGGLFYGDITVPIAAAQWKHTADNAETITGMIEDRNKAGRAIIATTAGVIVFDEGDVVKVVAGQNVIKAVDVVLPANAGNLVDKATAKTGFAGVLANQNLGAGVAQAANGVFFFASGNGVMTLKISSKDL